jgi:tetratricopeptide (TPR) repeat protein
MLRLLATLLVSGFFINSAHGQKQGQALVDSLAAELKGMKEDTNKVNALHVISYTLNHIDPEAGIRYSDLGLALSKKLRWDKGVARHLTDLGLHLNKLAKPDEALNHHNKALLIFQKIGWKKGVGSTLLNIGNVYSSLSRYDEALMYYGKSLKIREEIGDKKDIAMTAANMGSIYRSQGNFNEALRLYQKAQEIMEEMSDKQGFASVLQNQGAIFYETERYELALNYFGRSLKLHEELGNKRTVAHIHSAIGHIHVERRDTTMALGFYEKVLTNDAADLEATSGALQGIGRIQAGRHQYAEALKSLKKALRICEELRNEQFIAGASDDLGYIYAAMAHDLSITARQRKDLAGNAVKYSTIAMNLNKKIGAERMLMNDYATLSDAYSILGNTHKALVYLRLHNDISQKLLNKDKSRALDELHIKYQAEKKDAAIKLLKREKSIQTLKLKNKNYFIAGSILLLAFSGISFYNYTRRKKLSFQKEVSETEMKALRAQMNPHFIFNSLNSIYGFLLDCQYEDATDYLVKFTRLTRMILENSRHSLIPVSEEVETLSLYLELESFRLQKKMKYEILVDEGMDQQSTLIPPMILQPFIENSIWHGLLNKEGEGRLTIEIRQKGDMLQCLVQDNGIGRERSHEFKTGIIAGKTQSLGLKLTEERISIINKLKKSNAYVAVSDLMDDNKRPLGVKVELALPMEMLNDR